MHLSLRAYYIIISFCICASIVANDTNQEDDEVVIPSMHEILQDRRPSYDEDTLLTSLSREELEIDDVFHNIDTSLTPCGTWALQEFFMSTCNTTTIQRRQEAIRHLVNDPEALALIRDKCSDIQASLTHVLSYYAHASEQTTSLGAELYYDKLSRWIPKLNDSPKALNFGVHSGPILGVCSDGLIIPMLHETFNLTLSQRLYASDFSIPSITEITNNLKTTCYNTFSPINKYERNKVFFSPAIAATITTFSYIALCIRLCGTWQHISELINRYNTIEDIYQVTYHTARILRRAREIHTLLSRCMPEELNEFPAAELINTEASDATNAYLDQLLSSTTFNDEQEASSDVFERKPYATSQGGTILVTHHLLHSSNLLTDLLAYIAAADGISSVAHTYQCGQEAHNTFCFVGWDMNRDTPCIQLEGFWTPLLPADTAVGSNITLDTNNAIFTGPNGIGKSTAMKGVAHSLTLAHTFGIAPAQSAHMSLFDHVGTYLNIREDTQEGLSSFMAEKKRVDEFYEEIPQLQGNTFYIIDEPFRGTFADEAEKRVYKFGEFIDQHPRVMACIATHFAQPTQLSHEHRFANYHIGITENTDHSFQLTYRLEPGILDWWFNDPEKRSQFVDWISDHIAETQQNR